MSIGTCTAAMVFATVLMLTGCNDDPAVVHRATRPTEGGVEIKTLYVEGAMLEAIEGVLIEEVPPGAPDGPVRMGLRTEDGLDIYFLENRQLQTLQKALESVERDVVRLRLGGRVTIYRDDNYLLLEGPMALKDPDVEIREGE
jgi:hypothetical protein